jgi:hypothetical protein
MTFVFPPLFACGDVYVIPGDQTGATPIWSAAQWREAMRTIQEVAKEEGVLPLLHGIDSVHGANYVQVR